MEIAEFFNLYAGEAACKAFFKEKRSKEFSNCCRCGSVHLRWEDKSSRWRCKECKHTMSLKQGTVMEHSKLGFRVWLWGLYLMSVTKKGFSALEMQRLIGHSRYEPIWLMMHKIRISMGHRDDKHTLDGYIEMDEGFFEGQRKREPDGTASKELDRQVKAIVAVSTTPVEREKQKPYHPDTNAGYVKMSVVKRLSNNDVGYEAGNMIGKSATVITDGKRCYNALKDICMSHETVVVADKKQVCKIFPWVHVAISNAKKKLLGLHHQINDAYMQNYLNEFCYKFNRRFFGHNLFDRLVIAALEKPWYKPICG